MTEKQRLALGQVLVGLALGGGAYVYAVASLEYDFEKIDPGVPPGMVERLGGTGVANAFFGHDSVAIFLGVIGVVMCCAGILGLVGWISPSKTKSVPSS